MFYMHEESITLYYTGLNINACPGQVDFVKGQAKENFSCPTGKVTGFKF